MLSSISPLGERARHSRWAVTAGAYLFGSVVGGAALGTLWAALGAVVPTTWRASPVAAAVAAALLLLGLALDLRLSGLRLPMWRRQVDEAWLTRYRGWVYGLGFGAQLGFGLVTIVTSAAVYAVPLFCFLSGEVWVGLGIGLVFGLVRAAPVLAGGRTRDRGTLHRTFRRLERWRPAADRAAQGSLAAAAVVMIALTGLGLASVLTSGG